MDTVFQGLWPMHGRLVRVSPTKLYLVDADLGRGITAVALEGIDGELEEWLRGIDTSLSIEQLLWDADSHGLDLEVVGTVIRRLSELDALGEQVTMRAERSMRVVLVGHISEDYEREFSEWNATVLSAWHRSDNPWDQARSWDLVSERVEQVVQFKADLVIYVANSTVLDALDLAFLRKLRDRGIPHLPIGVTRSTVQIGPFVDFVAPTLGSDSGADVSELTVAGMCCDCWAQAQLQADADWANLMAQLVFVREPALVHDMLRLALAEAGRLATNWWHRNSQVAELYGAQLVTSRRDYEWEFVSIGASGTCRH